MATNPLDVLDLFEDVSNDEPDAKRAKLSPKKVNNEQWDTMFERLVEYKDSHGVRLGPPTAFGGSPLTHICPLTGLPGSQALLGRS